MTWLDIAFLVVLIVFLALGAKLGSFWTAACLIGGFLGGFLVDYYALPLSGMMGHFKGAYSLAVVLLFAGGVVAALLPGWIVSRLSGLFFLGILDSVMGLVTGALAWFIAVTLVFLLLLPRVPRVEKSAAWRNSQFVKPLHHFIEDLFNDAHFQRESSAQSLAQDFMKDFSPVVKTAEKSVRNASESLVEKFKKK